METLGVVIILWCFIAGVRTGRLQATLCRSCDSFQPIKGDDCSTSTRNHEIARGPDQNCIIRYTMTSSGLRLSKRVTSNHTCMQEYDPTCDRQSLVIGSSRSLTPGTVCSFCCRSTGTRHVYCSDGPFPDPGSDVLTTHVAITGKQTTQSKQSAPSKHTSATSSSSTPSTLTSATSTVSPTRNDWSSSGSSGQTSNVCSLCTIRPVDKGVTCYDTSTTCSGNAPLCMTSFYDNAGDILIIKRCASVPECDKLWWNQTRYKKECVQGDDPYTWSGTWSGECHYCCESDPSAPFWCNYPQYPNRPRITLNMVEFKNRFTTTGLTTDTTTTTTPSTETTTTTTPSTETTTTTTPSTETTTTTTPSTETTTTTTTSTETTTTTTPSTGTTTTTTPSTETTTTTTPSTETTTITTPSTETTTTRSTFPSLSSLPSATFSSSSSRSSSSSASAPSPSSSSFSPSAATSSPVAASGVQCEVSTCAHADLTNAGRRCATATVESCPSDRPYCLNTITESPTGNGLTITVTKRCVENVECYNDWWLGTRNNPGCQGDLTAGHVSAYGLICRFCCNSSRPNGDVCNLKAKPDRLVTYDLLTSAASQVATTSTSVSTTGGSDKLSSTFLVSTHGVSDSSSTLSTGTPSTRTSSTGTPSIGTQSTETQSTGTPSTGTQSRGTSSTGKQSTGTPSTGTPSTGTPSTGTPSTRTPSTGTPSTGTQSTWTRSTGTPSTGTPSTGTQSTGTPSTGTQSTGTQSTGTQSTGTQSRRTPSTLTPSTGTPYTGTQSTRPPSTLTPSTGTPYTGTQSTRTPSTLTPSTWTPYTGTQSTGTQSTGTQSTGTLSTLTQYTGMQSTGTPFTGTPSTGMPFSLISTNAQTFNTPKVSVVTSSKPLPTQTSFQTAYEKTSTSTIASSPSSISQVSIATTQKQSTASSLPLTTTPKVIRQCVQCGNTSEGVACSAFDLYFSQSTTCPDGLDFCLNHIHQKGDQTAVIKRCVDRTECLNRWFIQTSDNSACVRYDPSKQDTNLNCYYCCTTDDCNKPFLPSDNTLFTP